MTLWQVLVPKKSEVFNVQERNMTFKNGSGFLLYHGSYNDIITVWWMSTEENSYTGVRFSLLFQLP